MTNRKPGLTRDQAADVDLARVALEASMADTDAANYCEHLGAMEYHVSQLPGLIADLTGGAS